MNQNLKNFLLLLLLACCWGPSFMFMRVAVEYIPPITITASRLLIGSLVLYAILKRGGFDLLNYSNLENLKPSFKHLFIAGLLQSAIPFCLFAAGEQYVDSASAAIISGASPLFTLFLAHFFSDNDRITNAKLTGAGIGFSGLFILIFPSLAPAVSANIDAKLKVYGVLMILAAAMCYSIAFIYTKKYVRGFKPLVAPAIQLFLGFLFLLPFSLFFEHPWSIGHISVSAILSVISLGLLGTALAFVIYYKILEATSSTYISMVNYITPIIGAILGVIILNEKLGWNSYLGCVMILLGVMIANGLIKIFVNKKALYQ